MEKIKGFFCCCCRSESGGCSRVCCAEWYNTNKTCINIIKTLVTIVLALVDTILDWFAYAEISAIDVSYLDGGDDNAMIITGYFIFCLLGTLCAIAVVGLSVAKLIALRRGEEDRKQKLDITLHGFVLVEQLLEDLPLAILTWELGNTESCAFTRKLTGKLTFLTRIVSVASSLLIAIFELIMAILWCRECKNEGCPEAWKDNANFALYILVAISAPISAIWDVFFIIAMLQNEELQDLIRRIGINIKILSPENAPPPLKSLVKLAANKNSTDVTVFGKLRYTDGVAREATATFTRLFLLAFAVPVFFDGDRGRIIRFPCHFFNVSTSAAPAPSFPMTLDLEGSFQNITLPDNPVLTTPGSFPGTLTDLMSNSSLLTNINLDNTSYDTNCNVVFYLQYHQKSSAIFYNHVYEIQNTTGNCETHPFLPQIPVYFQRKPDDQNVTEWFPQPEADDSDRRMFCGTNRAVYDPSMTIRGPPCTKMVNVTTTRSASDKFNFWEIRTNGENVTYHQCYDVSDCKEYETVTSDGAAVFSSHVTILLLVLFICPVTYQG